MKKLIALLLIISCFAACFVGCNDGEAKGSVTLVSEADHDKVAAKIAMGEIEIAVLPEPKATVAINTAKAAGYNYSIKLNLSDEWSDVSENELAMGCIAVRGELVNTNEKALVEFLTEYKASIEYIGNEDNHASAAEMIVTAGILPKLPIAKSALNNLYGAIVYEDGQDMKATLVDFYDAISLTKPNDTFYYTPNSSQPADNGEKLVIGVMNGPTGMGMAKLINDYGKNSDKYEFRTYADPTLATADLTSGEIDMACLPTNTAAALANKGVDIKAAAINCLGSLYVVVKDGVTVNSIDDLIDKTVYYGVPNSTTAPILKYILAKNNIEVAS